VTNREALETGTEDLLGWVEDGVAVLSFNRPDARNALSQAMYGGFATALPQVIERSDIGCLVLTGEGGAFCAGGDVKGFAARNASSEGSGAPGAAGGAPGVEAAVDDLRRRQREVSLAIHHLPKTTIAAIPGAAAGAGLSIALSCDLRVASSKAIITTAFSKIGASGDFGGSWFLTQLVGPSRAKQLYLLSDRLSADEAERPAW
jgi:2-(1,2-epoxy-1,2-dihydrophenyl)acetyl-CoA isomerase